jgi:hypothetical protein
MLQCREGTIAQQSVVALDSMSLEIFYEKVAGMDIQEQGQTGSAAGRLLGRDHFLYRIPATHVRLEGKCKRSCCVCAERRKHKTGKTVKKCTTMYCRKCDVGLCIGAVF